MGESVRVKPPKGGQEIDWTSIDTPIVHAGTKISLPAQPEPMGYDDAITTIKRIRDQEAQKFDVNEIVAGAPWDALVAVYKAMQEIYGVVLSESRWTFFGEIRPDLITVNTGPLAHEKVQVPMGQMSLPNFDSPVHVNMFPGGVSIVSTVNKKDRARIVEIANKAREIMQRDSVYKGKAIRLGVKNDGSLDLNKQPEFLDLSKVQEGDMIHTAETSLLINTNVLAPLKYTEACRRHSIPLKRGILLEGRYGTGKSLTARVTAKVAIDHGWTFVMLDRSQGLRAAIEFAKTYQPCVIFAEDIDRAADRGEEKVNDLVNLIDGVISKNMEIMTVLTTNFIEKIDKALLRPGRFDAVISIQVPDQEAVQKLIRAYARELLPSSVELDKTSEVLKGQIPATIREVVERAKLGMLSHDRVLLTEDDLLASALGMKAHMELLEPKAPQDSVEKRFADAFREVVGGASVDTSGLVSEERLESVKDELVENIRAVFGAVRDQKTLLTGAATSAEAARKEIVDVVSPFTKDTNKVAKQIKDKV